MPGTSTRASALAATRTRILDVAMEMLARDPEASVGDIATAAGVVRRTVYGHFPTRADLVSTLAQRAVDEITEVLDEALGSAGPADETWVTFVIGLWPVTHRYRVLLALRRGEYGEQIHRLLEPVDQTLAGLIQRGQDSGTFGRHPPAGLLSQIAYTAVFTIADSERTGTSVGVRAAVLTSLLLLGVAEPRATQLADGTA